MTVQSALESVAACIVDGDEHRAQEAVEEALAMGLPPQEVVNGGLVASMRMVGDKWKAMEIFLPEVMMAVEAWQAAMDIIEPRLTAEARNDLKRGVVVIGTVKGDIHEIGKNIVAILLKTAGFEVHDLGTDVPASVFVSEAKKVKADIIAASALMTTTMPFQKDIVEYLTMRGQRDRYFVMVGGGPVTPQWAEEIGVDAYGQTADDAVRLALDHMDSRRRSQSVLL